MTMEGLPSLVSRLPLEKRTRTSLPEELILLDDDLPAGKNGFHFSCDFSALERVVVDSHVMRLGGEDVLLLGVEDHDVGVGSWCDRSLFGKEPEDLGGRRGRQLYEPVDADASLANAAVVDEMEPRFDPGRAVGDLGEVVLSQLFLLFHAERAVVGRDRLQVVARQPAPELLLVSLRSKRRAHDVLGALEAGL